MTRPDSLIFDMDGTLWDAVETYAHALNEGFKKMKIDQTISSKDLHHVVGWERKKALNYLLPAYEESLQEEIYSLAMTEQDRILPIAGGVLYEFVKEGIIELSTRYRIFIVSNCAKDTIKQFIEWAGLKDYIVDEIAHGVNNMPKHHNINLLIMKHGLKNPMYIGDTDSDRIQSELAKLPFVFVSYGFGKCENYFLKFSSFKDLTNHFMSLE